MCVEAHGEHGCGEADAQDLEDMEKKREDHVEKHPTNVFQAKAICAVDPFQATLSQPQKKQAPISQLEDSSSLFFRCVFALLSQQPRKHSLQNSCSTLSLYSTIDYQCFASPMGLPAGAKDCLRSGESRVNYALCVCFHKLKTGYNLI